MFEFIPRGVPAPMRLLLAAAVVLTSTCALAFPVNAPKGAKVGVGCIGPVKSLAPKLKTCSIASGDKKSRVWCPNGTAFDLDESLSPPPLARSLCQLTQIAD